MNRAALSSVVRSVCVLCLVPAGLLLAETAELQTAKDTEWLEHAKELVDELSWCD